MQSLVSSQGRVAPKRLLILLILLLRPKITNSDKLTPFQMQFVSNQYFFLFLGHKKEDKHEPGTMDDKTLKCENKIHEVITAGVTK